MAGARRARPAATLGAMCLAQAMILLDVTIVNVALPSIQRELGLSPGALEWVIAAYALALATFIPLGGALGDRLGRRRVFLIGMGLFTVASTGCALSSTDAQLIACRALQGFGGALMSALTLSILVEATPPDRRAWAIGTWAGVGGLGFGAGPIVGGLLLGVFDWSSIFWVNVPIGLVGLVLTLAGVAESRDPAGHKLDLVGVTLSAIGLFAITLGLVESGSRGWGAPSVLGLLVGGVAALAAFAAWERRTSSPMIPRALVGERRFLAANGVFLLAYLALTGTLFFVTLYYQNIRGWSALRTGLSWIPLNLPFLIVAQFAGRIAKRFPASVVIGWGCLLGAAGVLGLALLQADSPYLWAAASYVAVGLGYGLLVPACSAAAMSDVPAGASGIASGLLNTSRQVGTSVGLAVLGSIGAITTIRAWNARVATLPAGVRTTAHGLRLDVAGAQVDTVARVVGLDGAARAAASFLHGYHVAMGVACALLAAAGLTAFAAFQGPERPHG